MVCEASVGPVLRVLKLAFSHGQLSPLYWVCFKPTGLFYTQKHSNLIPNFKIS